MCSMRAKRAARWSSSTAAIGAPSRRMISPSWRRAARRAGITVAMPSYPLCPEASLKDITESCRERDREALARHALARRKSKARHQWPLGRRLSHGRAFRNDWAAQGLPPTPFRGGLSISGVFELEPLVNTTMNTAIGLDGEKARALSLGASCPHVAAPLVSRVGEKESPEFHRQSAELARTWPEVCRAPIDIPGRHHFDVVEELGRPERRSSTRR